MVELFTKKEFGLFDYKLILLCFQQWLPLMIKTSKIEGNKANPTVLCR